MLVNIEILHDEGISTKASFEIANFKTEQDYKEALSILFMISAEYYLDPEIELVDFKNYVASAKDKNKAIMALLVSEEGLELEFED